MFPEGGPGAGLRAPSLGAGEPEPRPRGLGMSGLEDTPRGASEGSCPQGTPSYREDTAVFNPGMEPWSPALQVDSSPAEPQWVAPDQLEPALHLILHAVHLPQGWV